MKFTSKELDEIIEAIVMRGPTQQDNLAFVIMNQSPTVQKYIVIAKNYGDENERILGSIYSGILIGSELAKRHQPPVDLLLFCPACGTQHVDEAKPDVCETCGQNESDCTCTTFTAWLNPPHKSHRCTDCNHVWRPADVPTNGVKELQSKGERDGDPVPHLPEAIAEADKALYWLILFYRATCRRGWEDGLTESEVRERIVDFLANRDLDPNVPKDAANVARFLGECEIEYGAIS